MQNNWQDLIPFYVAGTLDDEDRQQLERILAESEEARAALAEWQLIGDFVRSEAAMWSRGLPPLSTEVREATRSVPATRPNIPKVVLPDLSQDASPLTREVLKFPDSAQIKSSQAHPSSQRQIRIPFTLVASVLVVVIFGGLLFANLIGNTDQGQTGASQVADSGLAAGLETSILEPTSTQSDLGILTEPVVPSVTNTEIPLPTPTNASVDTLVTQPSPSWTPLPNECVAYAVASSAQVYAAANGESDVLATLPSGEYRRVATFQDADGGWYELIRISGGLLGWVRSSDIQLNGPCSDLAMPSQTPSSTSTSTACMLTPVDNTDALIYQEPSRESTVLQTIANFAIVEAQERTNTGWYYVVYNANGLWVGWVNAADANFSAGCESLPLTTVSTETPVPLDQDHSASPTPSTPVLRSFDVIDDATAAPGEAITLAWVVDNASRVSIEFYGGDVDPGDYGIAEPLSVSNNLAPTGSLDVVIPAQYTQSTAVFVLVLESIPDGERGPTSIVTVVVEQ